jgi:aspartate/methionine/tyrosine aminotransferase
VLVPAPYYAAFDADLKSFAEVDTIQVPLDAPDYALTPALLEAAYERVRAERGRPPRALLLTNPHNPLGRVMPRDELRAVDGWVASKGMHFVSDEIYALSVFDPGPRFVSLGELCEGQLGNMRHVLWGLSKDFGCSGLRCGMIWTQNEGLQTSLGTAAMFTQVSAPTQHIISDMLADEDGTFLDTYIEQNGMRLQASLEIVTSTLSSLGLPFVRPTSGMFIWIDMRSLLPLAGQHATGQEAEDALYEMFWKELGLVMTPGLAQHASEAGFFRICYAYVKPSVLQVAMQRLSDWIIAKRSAVSKM